MNNNFAKSKKIFFKNGFYGPPTAYENAEKVARRTIFMAKWLARQKSNQKTAGSIPTSKFDFLKIFWILYIF